VLSERYLPKPGIQQVLKHAGLLVVGVSIIRLTFCIMVPYSCIQPTGKIFREKRA
jgi:hypothetical protein